jgi:serine/threonine protein kinase
MHKRNIFHRDLTPENLFFDEEFNLKISNFGMAKIMKKISNQKDETDNYNEEFALRVS